jgi:NaMN:DMB phosphoribosyltransferase
MATRSDAPALRRLGAERRPGLVLPVDGPPREFVDAGPSMPEGLLDHTLHVPELAHQRHLGLTDPIEVLAAMGGHEVAMMVA